MHSFGHTFRVTVCGASHEPFTGVRVSGILAGIPLTVGDFIPDLTRRSSGAPGTTTRHEDDIPEILSGVTDEKTTGETIEIRFSNRDIRPADYSNPLHFRPSHADRTTFCKYGTHATGGGMASGRMTVALVAAGVIAKKLLPETRFNTKTEVHGDVAQIAAEKDSIGGTIECRVNGLLTGLGEPFFDSVESIVSHLLFSIPAVKGVEFGDGFAVADRRGSENNDLIVDPEGRTATNHDGGINGGITNGNELVVRVAIKPTPSIGLSQMTFNAATGRVEELTIRGRHDACIALRAGVVVEACVAIALADLKLRIKNTFHAASAVKTICDAIIPLYGEREASQIARLVVTELGGVAPTQLLLEPNTTVDIPNFNRVIRDLTAGRPVQYVLGHTEFCGLDLAVREGVLIPRPETEELVLWIANEAPPDATILDIGTGSGAIAIALGSLLPNSRVTAIELSFDALAIARENAQHIGVNVDFRQLDILQQKPDGHEKFDVIVSNPPYIPSGEREKMHRNVLEYEPAEALFVPDDDPLLFYRTIAEHARELLSPDGRLYFEIHEDHADDIEKLLTELGYRDTVLRCDIHEKPRMVCTRR